MGTGAMAIVAAENPGLIPFLERPLDIVAMALLILAAMAFLVLIVIQARSVWDHDRGNVGKGLLGRITAHEQGPLYATIPGSISVLCLAVMNRFPSVLESEAGWWLLMVASMLSTFSAIILTVVFFSAAFADDNVDAEAISGTWFVPETVMLLGVVLASRLAFLAPQWVESPLAVLTVALMGAGFILFLLTAALLFTRLVIWPRVARGRSAVWIMLSPLGVATLALHAVSEVAPIFGFGRAAAVTTITDLGAGMIWGFALWWLGAAAVLNLGDYFGKDPTQRKKDYSFAPSEWAFVFPPAALTIATIELARLWSSSLVELIGVGMATLMTGVWVVVLSRALMSLRTPVQAAPLSTE